MPLATTELRQCQNVRRQLGKQACPMSQRKMMGRITAIGVNLISLLIATFRVAGWSSTAVGPIQGPARALTSVCAMPSLAHKWHNCEVWTALSEFSKCLIIWILLILQYLSLMLGHAPSTELSYLWNQVSFLPCKKTLCYIKTLFEPTMVILVVCITEDGWSVA